MRVGFSSFVLQGGQSGIATYILNVLRALQVEDHENQYEVIVPKRDLPLLPKPGGCVQPYAVSDHYRGAMQSILWHHTFLNGLARRREYDVLLVPTARRIPANYRGRLVAVVHDLAPFHVPGKYDAARMFYNKRIIPWLIRKCDHIVTVSQFTKKDLMDFVGLREDQISVVYPGINRATFRPSDEAEARMRLTAKYGLDGPFLVYVSRLEHPGKNHVGLIEAFRLLKQRYKIPHRLVFAGADWTGAEEIHRYGHDLGNDILFTGFASQQDIVDMYSACDLMVYPSLFEGFGLPVIEAAACGSRVICSSTSSLKELAGGLFGTFDPHDVEELTQRIYDEINREDTDAERTQRMEYAHSFNWNRCARGLMEVLRKLA